MAKPAPLQKPPRTALAKDGSAVINVDVRSVLPKWTFEPAQLAGCKVPRIDHFMASAPPRKP